MNIIPYSDKELEDLRLKFLTTNGKHHINTSYLKLFRVRKQLVSPVKQGVSTCETDYQSL